MGFTHYYYRPEKLDQNKFNQAVADCAKLCKAIKAPICHNGEEDEPAIFSPTQIWFNGIDDDAHETFVVEQTFSMNGYVSKNEQGQYFAFCKTARKPYDTAVVACLIILKHYFGDDLLLKSDGYQSEWEEGLKAVQEHLGYGEIPDTISEK